jgi:lipid A 3-O-deacylase
LSKITSAIAIRKFLAALGSVAGCFLFTGGANAQGLMQPGSVFVQYGSANSTDSVTGGLTWNWDRKWELGSGQLSGFYEGFLSVWSYPDGTAPGHTQLAQIGFTPVFRWTPSHGESPWFVEGGIGLTLTSKLYQPTGKRFSTAFNFGDQIAVGRRFGETGKHEVSLRVQHFSNGSIKHPNPGENFFELRYAYRFQ